MGAFLFRHEMHRVNAVLDERVHEPLVQFHAHFGKSGAFDFLNDALRQHPPGEMRQVRLATTHDGDGIETTLTRLRQNFLRQRRAGLAVKLAGFLVHHGR